jgi:conjugal transfer/entry exclusion protein
MRVAKALRENKYKESTPGVQWTRDESVRWQSSLKKFFRAKQAAPDTMTEVKRAAKQVCFLVSGVSRATDNISVISA